VHRISDDSIHKSKTISKNLFDYFVSKAPMYQQMPLIIPNIIPPDVSRLASQYGIQNLQERCIIPSHIDIAPAITGRYNRRMLRPLKAKLFETNYTSDSIGNIKTQFEKPNIIENGTVYNYRMLSEQDVKSCPDLTGVSTYLKYMECEIPCDHEILPGWLIFVKRGILDTSTSPFIAIFKNL
jgi:hypothetical protein